MKYSKNVKIKVETAFRIEKGPFHWHIFHFAYIELSLKKQKNFLQFSVGSFEIYFIGIVTIAVVSRCFDESIEI